MVQMLYISAVSYTHLERYELLAMKAAGISLLKIMRPLAFFVCGLVGVSFYFQNVVGPVSYTHLDVYKRQP